MSKNSDFGKYVTKVTDTLHEEQLIFMCLVFIGGADCFLFEVRA